MTHGVIVGARACERPIVGRKQGRTLESVADPVRAALLSTVATVVALISGSTFAIRYLSQAALGQARITLAARPIRDAAGDSSLDPGVRRLLAAVPAIKEFGRAQGLRPTASYESFVDLRRSAAAWVVQACAPLSFEARRWRFPLLGSVPYLGFFDAAGAEAYARALEREGLDVDVRTAGAYSTLGWLRDPVLSTMIGAGPEAAGDLANLVLHESVHATVYVKDQSAFDESLASFVADGLTPAFLARAFGTDAPETRAWSAAHARERARTARLHRAYVELDAIYRSAAAEGWKRAAKARVLRDAAADLHLATPPNNAALAGYRAYDTGTAAFQRLLAACDGSWPRLLRSVQAVSPRDFAAPQADPFDATVERLARDHCSG